MKYVKFLFFIILFWLIVHIVTWTKESSKHIQSLKSFHASMPYEISQVDSVRFDLPQKGEFGAMAGCIKKFRSKTARKIKDVSDGRSGLLKIHSGSFMMYLSVYGDEVNSIRLFKFDESGGNVWQTSSYAINCDLTLMNKI